MSALVQSIRALAQEYGAEFGLAPAELLAELRLGFCIIMSMWGLQALVLAAFGK